jgi:hypothetical protein
MTGDNRPLAAVMDAVAARGADVFRSVFRLAARHDTPIVAGAVTILVIANSASLALQGALFLDGHHPGNMLGGALNLLHGQPLFSQVQSVYGLLQPYANALQLYVFGERYLSLWILPTIAFAGGLIILYELFKGFLRRLESALAVLLIIALNQAVLTPSSHYIVFGLSALLVWRFAGGLEKSTLTRSTLFGLGVLLLVAALFRSQAILLYPVLLVALFIYDRDNWTSKAGALSLGLLLSLATFVLKLAHDGVLRDYYLQTIAIQNLHYFRDKGALHGLRQVLEVFATGRAPDGLPNPPVGFAPFNALFGRLWLCIFLLNAYVVIHLALRWLSGAIDRSRLFAELPPGVLCLAMLTLIGPLFSIHNVWDNFRYAMHMAPGIGVVFYLADRISGRDTSRAIVLTLALFFAAPLYSTFDATRSSVKYLRERAKAAPAAAHAKYFDGISLPSWLRDRLVFADQFFAAFHEKYPDSYIYTSEHTITDAIYAVGRFPIYHKTLTNDHFAATTYWRYYPEHRAKFDEAARSRKLIFLSFRGDDDRLKEHDYVKFREINGLSVFIARERAENFSMP